MHAVKGKFQKKNISIVKKESEREKRKEKTLRKGMSIYKECAEKNNELNNQNIEDKIVNYFLYKKTFHIIKLILHQRKKASDVISSFLHQKLMIIKLKKDIMIQKIIQIRQKQIIKIQSVYRKHLVQREIMKIIQRDYVFFYSIFKKSITELCKMCKKPRDNDDVKILIFLKKSFSKLLTLSYSKYLHCFYLLLDKKFVFKRHYRVNIIINGQRIIDSRYDVESDSRGNFYNKIHKKFLYTPKKRKITIPIQNNYWENIFKIRPKRITKISEDSFSSNSNISDEPNIDNIFPLHDNYQKFLNSLRLKSILKKDHNKSDTDSCNSRRNNTLRVSFNTNIQYSY